MQIKGALDFLNSVGRKVSGFRLINSRKLHGVWEQNHLRKLLSHFDVDCVFDVGANYGQYAKMLRSKAGFKGLIISFEPIPAAAAALRRLSANDPLWIVEERALSKDNGEQIFHVMADSQFSSLSEPTYEEVQLFNGMNKVSQELKVTTETLDSAFQRLQKIYNFQRPFLKMDTQGFDVEILTHGLSAAKSFIGLQSELSVKKIYKDSVDFKDALRIYEECGFSLSAFVPNNIGHFPLLIETDCIMVRSDLVPESALVFNQ